MPISTHILDLAGGRPAAGVRVRLERRTEGGRWIPVGEGQSDSDGRVDKWVGATAVVGGGTYRLRFDTADYFARQDIRAFFPEVQVTFEIAAGAAQCHGPLLLSPYGYSTYRGS